jgi:hypothetical protein
MSLKTDKKTSRTNIKHSGTNKVLVGSLEVSAPGASPELAVQIATTEDIVQELLARGLSPEQIHMPGALKGKIVYISDDFDDELVDFDVVA